MWLFSEKNTQNETEANGLSVSLHELYAQQKYLPYLSLKNTKTVSDFSGDIKSAFKGRGMELEELRKYTFGDDVRDMDWRVTARKCTPYTRIYAQEKDREIMVFLDLSASMVFGTKKELKSVCAAKIAAMLGWMAVKNKDRFGILIYDGLHQYYFKAQNNRQNLTAIFKKIASVSRMILQNNAFGDMSEAMKTLEYHQKGQGIIFILSDFFNFNKEKFMRISALAQKNTVYCLNIFDILEDVCPPDGIYKARFGKQKIEFDTYLPDFKANYQKHFANNRDFIKKNCQKFSCKYLEIRTDVPVFKQLRLM